MARIKYHNPDTGKWEYADSQFIVGGNTGGNVDLTGYATEQFVRDGYQPKGEYLTEVPDGYAKTEDIPTKPEDIGALPNTTKIPSKTSELTNDSKFASEEFVTNKIAEAELGGGEVDLGGYLQKSELTTTIDAALAQAKESGEFDGAPGAKGDTGAAGKTPVRGTDYWTASDIAEIKSYVDEAILGGAW